MKKLMIGIATTISIFAGASALAEANKQPSASMVRMFAISQDMTEHQQDLAVEVFHQVKELARTVKSPKHDVKAYLQGLVTQDHIDVNEVMEKYKAWQQQVDKEFEQSVVAVANLHADLSVEQRQKLIESMKKLRSNS